MCVYVCEGVRGSVHVCVCRGTHCDWVLQYYKVQ